MSRSPAMSGKATATKSLNEKWLSIVQSMREKGENDIGGSSIITQKGYSYEVVEREMVEHGTISKRERRKWDGGVLYHNITPVVASRPQLECSVSYPFRERVHELWLWLDNWCPHD